MRHTYLKPNLLKQNLSLLCSALALTALLLSPAVKPAHAVSSLKFNYQANAYGTYAYVAGGKVISGRTSVVGLGCTTQPGISNTNTTASVNVSPTLSTGLINTSASSALSSTQHKAQATSTIHNVNLLDGLITASEVKAVSTTTYSAAGFSRSSAGSYLLNLKVAGVSISSTPAANTKINLPGFGYVILHERSGGLKSTSAYLNVNMIHVVITTTNTLGIAPNTHIIVAHARSGLTGPVAGVLGGQAYISKVTVGNTLTSGKTALVTLPCLGTGGAVKSNNIAALNLPIGVTSGSGETTAQGSVTATSAYGITTATVQNVNVLNGLITASTVKARTNGSTNGTTFTFNDTGTQFVGLSVAGHPAITSSVSPNTQVTISGLGTLYLRRVIKGTRSIEVRMIELVVTQSNTYGLAIGTRIQVSVSNVIVR